MSARDDWCPLDADESAAQIECLRRLVTGGSRRVLDLGCGDGRTMAPLVDAGHHVTGFDIDADAIAACRARCPDAALVQGDFLRAWPAFPDAVETGFDAVTCLGHTMMTVVDVDAAVALFGRIAAALRPGGVFVMDDLPHQGWAEVAEGNWPSGLSEDGASQMVWRPGDAVFAWRRGDEVDPASWEVRASDRPLRLWSLGALRLAAAGAGLSEMSREAGGGLLIMRFGQP